MYRILHIIHSFLGSMSKRKECMKISGGRMMNKRKWLYRIGVLLFSIGLILANFTQTYHHQFLICIKELVSVLS